MEKEQYQLSAEEQAGIEKKRTLSDAKLLKDGAEYMIDDEGEKELHVTEDQREEVEKTMELDLESKAIMEEQEVLLEDLSAEKIFDVAINGLISATNKREYWEDVMKKIKSEAVEKGKAFNPDLKTCVCPTCVGAYLIRHGDKHHGEWLQRLATSGNLDWIFLKDL